MRHRFTFFSPTIILTILTTVSPELFAETQILPLGDSLTAGFHDGPTSSYRYFLEQSFLQHGIDYDFIGSQTRGGNVMVDPQHEGHGGWTIEQITSIDVDSFDPDLVLVMAGTNNHWSTPDYGEMRSRYEGLFDAIGDRPTVVSTLPGFGYPRTSLSYWTEEFVAERNEVRFPLMNQVIHEFGEERDNIYVVDFASEFDSTVHLFDDQVHLNVAGQELLATAFLGGISEVIAVPEPASSVHFATVLVVVSWTSIKRLRGKPRPR